MPQVHLTMGDLGAAAFASLDPFTQSYVECMFWTSGYLEPWQDNLSFDQLNPGALDQMKADCKKFQSENAAYLELAYKQPVYGQPNSGYTPANAGYDFALSRNGHGSGFFDRKHLGEIITKSGASLDMVLQERARAFGESYCYTVPEIEDDNGRRLPDVDVAEVEVFYN